MSKETILDIFNEALSDFSKRAIEKLDKEPNFIMEQQLYHYTSFDALQRIIDSQSFQATSIYMMNDPNELVYGFDSILSRFPDDFKKNINSQSRYKSINGYPAFVFCLTELKDDMYYWDKYGDKHRGVRIGFTPNSLIKYWYKIPNISVILLPVVYESANGTICGNYSEIFEEFRGKFISDVIEYSRNESMDDIDKSNIGYCIALMASMIKREEWKIESEWRVICIAGGCVHESIKGIFINGRPVAKLVNKTEETYSLLTNMGHGGVASKDIIKIGSHVESKEFVEYVIKLLLKEKTGTNYYDDVISKSVIQTR